MILALSTWAVMRIICPACATTYEVPDASLRARRKLRCDRCGATWTPADVPSSPPPVTSASGAAAPFAPATLTAMERLSATAPPPRDPALFLAWVATLVILAAAAAAIVIWREQIVHAWPASARLLGSG